MDPDATELVDAGELARWVIDARERSFRLLEDLGEDRLLGPKLDVVNPPLWEFGHLAWFQERWVLREGAGMEPLRADGDSLYDSTAVAHSRRWSLPLPSLDETLDYLRQVRDRVLKRLEMERVDPRETYFISNAVFHEDMHAEAFGYSRQTLGYPQPPICDTSLPPVEERPRGDDVTVPGGSTRLGAEPYEPFVFDNEKWAHAVQVERFHMAREAVTQRAFAEFVEGGCYATRSLWSRAGWEWKERESAEHPVYWRRSSDGGWQRRHFDRWLDLEPDLPVIHVNAHEAEAFCRWAGRRLPTELEWEVAAACDSNAGSANLSGKKKRYPWGDAPPSIARAHLDWGCGGTVDVQAREPGECAFGCRQLIGNVWEWTSSTFHPYPGFEPDPYKEYSEPWFGTRRVLRGGSWMTASRLIRNTCRNFYEPHRRDVMAGFRTCAP